MTTTNMGRNIHENMRKSWKVIEPHEIHGVFCCWTFVATWWTNTTIERCNSWRLEGFFWWFCIWSIAYTLPKTNNRYPTSDGFANISPLKYVHFWVSCICMCIFLGGKRYAYIITSYKSLPIFYRLLRRWWKRSSKRGTSLDSKPTNFLPPSVSFVNRFFYERNKHVNKPYMPVFGGDVLEDYACTRKTRRFIIGINHVIRNLSKDQPI